MSLEENSSSSGGINVAAIEVCLSLSATENMVQNIFGIVASTSDLYDPQMMENLKQVMKCLMQTRGTINSKFGNTRPWLDPRVSAKFDSKMVLRSGGGEEQGLPAGAGGGGTAAGMDQDFRHTFDMSSAFAHKLTGCVIMFLGMESNLDEEQQQLADSKDHLQRYTNGFGGAGGGDPSARGAFKCAKCDISFDDEEYLKQHEALFVHDKYKCEKCSKSFSWKKVFDRHSERCGRRGDGDDDGVASCKEEATESDVKDLLDSKPEEDYDPATGGIDFPDDGIKQEVGGIGYDDNEFDSSDHAAMMMMNDYGGGGEEEENMFTDYFENETGYGEGAGDDNEEVEKVGGQPMVQCNICGKVMLKSNRSHHRKIHTGIKPHSCDVCGKSFLRHDNMKKHMQIHGHREKIYCESCGKGFYNQVSLNKHVMKDDSECDQSQYVEQPKREPRFNKKGKKVKSDPKVECEVCGKLQRKSNLKKHFRVHTGERPFTCTLCDKNFISKYNLKLHITTNHPDMSDELLAAIKYNPMSASERPSLRNMLDSYAMSKYENGDNLNEAENLAPGEKPYSCTVCGKGFFKRVNLKVHMKRIHGPRETILCQTCGKKFLSANSLKKHLQRGGCENADKPKEKLSCKICGKVVKSDCYLRSHMQVHSEEKPYCCEICGESFRRPYEINKHKIQRHEQPKCDMCPKSFTTLPALKRHIQSVHLEERPFSCDMCGKTYKDKSSLKKHTVRHHKDVHVKCELCTQSFNSVGDLNRHCLRDHRESIDHMIR